MTSALCLIMEKVFDKTFFARRNDIAAKTGGFERPASSARKV